MLVTPGRGGSGSNATLKLNKVKLKAIGGSGGKGGGLVLIRSTSKESLCHLSQINKIKCKSGHEGMPGPKSGGSGEDILIRIPHNSKVFINQVQQDINNSLREIRICSGGRGGKGNVVSGIGRATPGEIPEDLELKITSGIKTDFLIECHCDAYSFIEQTLIFKKIFAIRSAQPSHIKDQLHLGSFVCKKDLRRKIIGVIWAQSKNLAIHKELAKSVIALKVSRFEWIETVINTLIH